MTLVDIVCMSSLPDMDQIHHTRGILKTPAGHPAADAHPTLFLVRRSW
jgi:hypothetical protein